MHCIGCHPALRDDVVVEEILSSAQLTPSDLTAAAVVHKKWLDSARRSLYRVINVAQPNGLLARTMHQSAELQKLVRIVHLVVHIVGDAQTNILEFALGWIDGTRVRELHINCRGDFASSVVAQLVQRWRLPALRRLSLEGLHVELRVPEQVQALSITGATQLDGCHVPATLRELSLDSAYRVPVGILGAVRVNLQRLALSFAPFVAPALTQDDKRGAQWNWPVFGSLSELSIVSQKPLLLKLDKLCGPVSRITLSVCLLESNLLPDDVVELTLAPPGRLTVDLAQCVVSRIPHASPETGGLGKFSTVRIHCDHEPGVVTFLRKHSDHVVVNFSRPIRRQFVVRF